MPVTHPNKTAIVTIVSNNYLHFARTMLQSAKRHHPDYAFYCVIVDRDLSHALTLSAEFETIPIAKLHLPLGEEFLFQYNILELNTAVKPWAIEYLFARGHDNVFYVDPDIFFYAQMTDVEQMLSTNTDIVITPHLLAPVADEKQPRELDIRRAGTYNFGFCALRGSTNTRKFLHWWQSKLTRDCVNDADRGLFVDQSWIDLVPGLFENVGILRHKGYNVAYWNIAQRPLEKRDENRYFVDDQPLVFFHFSGLDPSDPEKFSKHQSRFTLSTVGPAKGLVVDYVNAVKANAFNQYAKLEYAFGRFSNGEQIPDIFRNLYRLSSALRGRMASRPPHPDDTCSPEAAQCIPGPSHNVNGDSHEFTARLPDQGRFELLPIEHGPFARASAMCDTWSEILIEGVSPTNAMMALWNVRHDVRAEFPLNTANSIKAYYRWFVTFPPGAQHYSAAVISRHVAEVKRFDNEAKLQAANSSASRRKDLPGNEQRVHRLYKYLLNHAPDESGLLGYSEMCKTDVGFIRAWGEIGLSDESKKKKFLWLRMLRALLISIYKVDKRAPENPDKTGSAQSELTEQSYAGIFPVEADASTRGVWVTDKVSIPITARRGDRIQLDGIYFPESIEKQTGSGESTIRFLLRDTEIYSTQLSTPGKFAIEFPVPKLRGPEITNLVIESSKAFVPKSIGPSDDERKLAWRMTALVVGNTRVFDCTHEDTFPKPHGHAARPAAAEATGFGLAKLAYSGFFQADPDSEEFGVWASANIVVPVVPIHGEKIQLRGVYFPESIAKQTGDGESTLRFFLGGKEVHSVILSERGDFTADFTLPELNEVDNQLHIQCSKTFVPRSIGESDDDRILSWRIKTLTTGRITVFDCARQNIATSNRRFVPRMTHNPDFAGSQVKLFAFYLPQYARLPKESAQRSDKSADWADVSNAMPQYADHHQPQLPVELGFYDYRSAGVLKRQVFLAKQYGIAGFCFHHHWRAAEQLADQPLDRFLADPSLTIEFCVCLVNENPAQLKDGTSLPAQSSAEQDMAFIDSLAPAFADTRCRRIEQKPILIVANILSLPDAAASVSRWRAHASKLGLPGLYLIASLTNETLDLRTAGFDALVVIPPSGCIDPMHDITSKIESSYPKFAGRVYDYRGLAAHRDNLAKLGLATFEAVMPAWDNEVLAPGTGTSFADANPEQYANWLSKDVTATANKRVEEQLLFINAWNAWREGAHLEPDQRYGYGYLHATACVLINNSVAMGEQLIGMINNLFTKRFDTVVIVHIYYEDLIDSIFDTYLSAAQTKCDLIVSVMQNISVASLGKIKDKFGNCFIIQTVNRGRDIRPFISALRKAHELGYLYGCKVHTKKSLQLNNGEEWRTQLIGALLSNAEQIESIVRRFANDPSLGILAPERALYDLSKSAAHFGNTEWLNKLIARLGEEKVIGRYNFLFPAGSMYWFRVAALPQLLSDDFVSLDDFELEAGQLNGTLAHAMERIIGLLATRRGFEIGALIT